MIIECANCGKEHKILDKEYRRQIRNGRDIFCCSRRCSAQFNNKRRDNTLAYRESKYRFEVDWQNNLEVKSYLIGYMFGDGTITDRKAAIMSTDLQIIEDFKKVLEYTGPINNLKKASGIYKPLYGLSFFANNAQLISDLGVLHDKEDLTIEGLDLDFYAFLRGFMDSDGTICVRECGKLSVSFIGRNKLIESIRKRLIQEGFNKKEHKPRGCIYNISFYGANALKLLDRMYKNNTICLQRKYQKYLDYVDSHCE